MRKIWTEEDTAMVKALRKQGLTISAIAEKMGRTEKSVQAWLSKHHLRKHKKEWMRDEERQLMWLLEQGLTYEMAGQALHRGTKAVINRAWLIRARERT